MKYLCIAYEEERKLNELSRGEWQALRQETLDYVESLRKRGRLIITHALRSATTASTVRVRGGQLSVADGPFAETKDLGSIEVRPIEDELGMDRRYGG
jgi:hypothetical protein